MNTENRDEFFLGYASEIPREIRQLLLKFIPLLVISAIAFAIILPLVHSHFNSGKVGSLEDFEGLLLTEPVPHIMVPTEDNNYSRYVLSGRGKTAAKAEILEHTGQWVKLSGSPVNRNNATLIAAKSAEVIESPATKIVKPEAGKSLGKFSLTGEIIDSKCYLGTMKPGQTKTHRGCAIRCISGGVPPALITHNQQGDEIYLALVDSQGKAVNERILDLIADPVKINGEVVQYNNLFVLKADPDSYELL